MKVTHGLLLQKEIQSQRRVEVQAPLHVDLRAEPPIGDEDLVLGREDGVADVAHEGRAVHVPAAFLVGPHRRVGAVAVGMDEILA